VVRDPLTADEVVGLHRLLSNWGRWGPDDELGALNLVTPSVTLAAANTVERGETVSCARALPTEPGPDNPHPVVHEMLTSAADGYGADSFTIASHGYSTSHLDALCHVFFDGQMYNGRLADEVLAPGGATGLAIDLVRTGIATRGVLLDVPRARGLDALEPGERIFPDDLDVAERETGLRVRSGDALLVRTGRWRWRDEHGPWDPAEGLAGLDASCLPWLHERDVAVLGGDGVTDVFPSPIAGFALPVHSVAIASMGVWLLDNLDLEDLARTCDRLERWAFLLTVGPLVLEGGTGSPVNPICLF
jgi:kynurenine formamidase